MASLKSLCILALFSAGTVSGASAAQHLPRTAGNPFLTNIRAGLSADEFTASVLAPFDEIAGRDGVISAQAMRDRQSAHEASRRASAIGAVLSYDLDGDLRVTASEILRTQAIGASNLHPARTKKASAKSDSERLLLQYDSNRDGAIAMTEVAQANLPDDRSGRGKEIVALLESNLGKDGKLTRKEVKAYAQRAFRSVDTDNNGRISGDEYAALS